MTLNLQTAFEIDDLTDIGTHEKLLLWHVWRRGAICYDSLRSLANVLNCSPSRARDAKKRLLSSDYHNPPYVIETIKKNHAGITLNHECFESIQLLQSFAQRTSTTIEDVRTENDHNNTPAVNVRTENDHNNSIVVNVRPENESNVVFVRSEIPEGINKREEGKKEEKTKIKSDRQALDDFISKGFVQPVKSECVPNGNGYHPVNTDLNKRELNDLKDRLREAIFKRTFKHPRGELIIAMISAGYDDKKFNEHYGPNDPGPDKWWWRRDYWAGDKGSVTLKMIEDSAATAIDWQPIASEQQNWDDLAEIT